MEWLFLGHHSSCIHAGTFTKKWFDCIFSTPFVLFVLYLSTIPSFSSCNHQGARQHHYHCEVVIVFPIGFGQICNVIQGSNWQIFYRALTLRNEQIRLQLSLFLVNKLHLSQPWCPWLCINAFGKFSERDLCLHVQPQTISIIFSYRQNLTIIYDNQTNLYSPFLSLTSRYLRWGSYDLLEPDPHFEV